MQFLEIPWVIRDAGKWIVSEIDWMRATRAITLLLALCCSMTAAARELDELKPRNIEPVSTRARDTYGDKSLVEMTDELALMTDELQGMMDDYRKHFERLNARISRQRDMIRERQEALAFLRREGSQRYFWVHPGSLRRQLEELRFALGLNTIRWAKNIPGQCDWQFDSSFKIDKSNQGKALEAFFSGIPLLPQLFKRDNSATITALEVIKCD
jgi:hypothetical protein